MTQAAETRVRVSFSSRIVFSKFFRVMEASWHIQISSRKFPRNNGTDCACVACPLCIAISSGGARWRFVRFQINFLIFFMQLKMEFIEIHLQINKTIAAISTPN